MIKLELTIEEINVALKHLGNGIYTDVGQLIAKIHAQALPQVEAAKTVDDNPWFPETLRLEKDSLFNRDREAYNTVWEGVCRQTVDGAIFAKEMQQAEFEQRITRVPYDATKPVLAIFDIGWADATAIWFVQFIGMETRLIR